MKLFKIIFFFLIFIVFNLNVVAQEITAQQQSKIDEYQILVDKYKSQGNNGSAVNFLIKIGNIYWQANDSEHAISSFIEADNLLENSSNATARVQLNNSLGFLYMGKGDYAIAEGYFTEAYQMSMGFANTSSMSSSLLNIAQCQKNQQKYNEAIVNYEEALTLALEAENLLMAKNSATKIALCYQAIDNTDKYNYYYNLSVKFDKETKDKIIAQKEAEAFKQSQIAQQNAMLFTMEEYKNKMMSDSLFLQQKLNEQNEAQIDLLNKQKELQDMLISQQEKEIAYEKDMAKAKNRIISLLIGGILIFVIAFLLILRLYYQNKKQKERLKTLYDELSIKNSEIEKQKEVLLVQKNDLANQNQKISDSIDYASRIQQAILPVKKAIEEDFKGAFIFYRPREVVSGDFYWYVQKGKEKIIAAIDCTGHSVPGAFMSMIANTLLNEIIKVKGETRLDVVLNRLHEGVIKTLFSEHEEDSMTDGMDISLFKFTDGERKAKYAFAGHYAIVFIDGKRKVIDGDFHSIGGMKDDLDIEFEENELDLGKEAFIYLFSDGFIDQFNKKRKKYMSKNFISLLEKIQPLSLKEQEQEIESEFNTWKQGFSQIDDVLVIGLNV